MENLIIKKTQMTFSRELVSIMFTDIIGYTKLVQSDEQKALAIRNKHRAVTESIHQQYGGKIIPYLGEGTLSIFKSAIDSVKAAIAIQIQLQHHPRVPLRMGLHLEEVVIKESEVIGNGVHLAARIASMGVAGVVLISKKMMEEIRKQQIQTEWIGTYPLENDEFPCDIYAVKAPGLGLPSAGSLAAKTESAAPASGREEKTPAEPEMLSVDERFRKTVKDIILKNLANPQFSVEILSKEMGYSRPQLYRKVKALTNLSPSDLIRKIRLKKAARLLKNNTGNVSEIAYETGFNNLSYFSKAFQEQFGVSPSEYARNKPSRPSGPVSLSRFFGRKKELQELRDILRKVRLLTLTGTGGTGKTRLSRELLTQVSHSFDHGFYFVPLAPLVEADQVLPKIAQVLKMQQDPSKETLLSLMQWIGKKEVLLVLDNFEHVLDAAGHIGELLLSCPALKVLITSRVIVGLSGEHEYPVSQLPVPGKEQVHSLEQLKEFPAVQLFINRAQAAKPDFQLQENNWKDLVTICRQLDGLPLALELGAARIKLFSPRALARRLHSSLEILSTRSSDHPDRHKTLRQAISWSYDLLSPEERTLFRRLSVFSGGCTLRAAEKVCFRGYSGNVDFLDCISGLVDKSLLYRQDEKDGEPRFYLLETLRVFGRERMEAAQETEEIVALFTGYYINLLQEAETHLAHAGKSSWLDRLEMELDNIRAILNWAVEQQNGEIGLKIATSFWRFWTIRSMMREGAQWMDRILNLPTGPEQARLRCKGLNAYGIMFTLTDSIRDSIEIFEKARDIARDQNFREELAQALNYLGWACQYDCQFERGIKFTLEAQQLFKATGDLRGLATTYNNMAFMEFWRGNLPKAAKLCNRGKKIRHQIGDLRGYAFMMTNEVWGDYKRGTYDKVVSRLDEALGILTDLSDNQLWAWSLVIKSGYFLHTNQLPESLQLARQALPLWYEVGTITGQVLTELLIIENRLINNQTLGLCELLQDLLQRAAQSAKFYHPYILYAQMKLSLQEGDYPKALEWFELGLREIIDLTVFLVLPDTLELFSSFCLHLNRPEMALTTFEFSRQFRQRLHIVVPPVRAAFVYQARSELDEIFDRTAWEKTEKKVKNWSVVDFAEMFQTEKAFLDMKIEHTN